METVQLTPDKFQEIYSNEAFRNEVAFAHSCLDKYSVFKHKQTASYPVTYIVTEEQIALAHTEFLRKKEEVIKANENKLMFVGMGATYTARYTNDVCNHRIRTEFKNNFGDLFFIEFAENNGNMFVTHANNVTKEIECNYSHNRQGEYYNWKNLERSTNKKQYSLDNILSFVNTNFDCSFTGVVIDNYNISTADFTCTSPDLKPENDYKVRFVITADRNGNRSMISDNNHRNTYRTRQRANEQLRSIITNNTQETIKQLLWENLEVTATTCYSSGDSTRTIF